MAARGCEVLHYRAAACAYTHKIPLEIRSSFVLGEKGTVVVGDEPIEGKV